ncbi:MAG: dTMP kinase [Acidimicrobiales bacterium]
MIPPPSPEPHPGAVYVALEGAEACGKSTHAARLAAELDAVLTRETGGTAIGARIRAILHDTEVTDLADRAEALLTAADRAQHLHQVVLPALASGRPVVSDRSVYSTLAYQGYGRMLDVDELRHINGWAIQGTWPQLVLLLDVDPSVQASRMHGRELDRFEREDDAFHQRVRDGFTAMAAADPEHWVVIDASGPLDGVYDAIRTAVRDRTGL